MKLTYYRLLKRNPGLSRNKWQPSRLNKQEAQLLPGWADCTVYIRKPGSNSDHNKTAIS